VRLRSYLPGISESIETDQMKNRGNGRRSATKMTAAPPASEPSVGRRAVLRGAFASGVTALFGSSRYARGQSQPDPSLGLKEWMTAPGRGTGSVPYGSPSRFEADVVRRMTNHYPTNLSAWSLTPLDRLTGIITPNGLVFERHHAGIPEIDPEHHRLAIHGLVKHPRVLSMDDILRLPAVSQIRFLECAGNGYTEVLDMPRSKTVQFSHGLLSCCEWTGVALSTILEEVGVRAEAKWVLAEGGDAAAMARSIPIEKALDDTLVVYAQNGEMLRPEQGYPLRLLVPGYEGNLSIKWLRRLKLGAAPWHTRDETSKYTDLMPDGTVRQFTLVMETKSVITRPSGGHILKGRGVHEISGLAWSGRGRISAVDVSADGGRNWQRARLDEPVLSKALTRFRFPWQWQGGPALLQSRAVDETGYVQPTREQLIAVRGTKSEDHFNAIQTWRVDETGNVTNALIRS
jgi:sulfane dehydrogenase subunit SoxC